MLYRRGNAFQECFFCTWRQDSPILDKSRETPYKAFQIFSETVSKNTDLQNQRTIWRCLPTEQKTSKLCFCETSSQWLLFVNFINSCLAWLRICSAWKQISKSQSYSQSQENLFLHFYATPTSLWICILDQGLPQAALLHFWDLNNIHSHTSSDVLLKSCLLKDYSLGGCSYSKYTEVWCLLSLFTV